MPRWIVFPLIVVSLAITTGAFAQEECVGPFKGKTPDNEDLAKVFANHQAWMKAACTVGDSLVRFGPTTDVL